MKNNIVSCIAAAALGAALISATPALAFRGGGGGGGFSGFHGGMFAGRSVFVPGAGRIAGAPFAGQRIGFNRFNKFGFRHRFRNFVFVGAPFGWGWDWPYYDYGYSGCWQRVWTGYGWRWVDACYNYGY